MKTKSKRRNRYLLEPLSIQQNRGAWMSRLARAGMTGALLLALVTKQASGGVEMTLSGSRSAISLVGSCPDPTKYAIIPFRETVRALRKTQCPLDRPGKPHYYLSPTGSDANPGTLVAPFQTLAKLNSMIAASDGTGVVFEWIFGSIYLGDLFAFTKVTIGVDNVTLLGNGVVFDWFKVGPPAGVSWTASSGGAYVTPAVGQNISGIREIVDPYNVFTYAVNALTCASTARSWFFDSVAFLLYINPGGGRNMTTPGSCDIAYLPSSTQHAFEITANVHGTRGDLITVIGNMPSMADDDVHTYMFLSGNEGDTTSVWTRCQGHYTPYGVFGTGQIVGGGYYLFENCVSRLVRPQITGGGAGGHAFSHFSTSSDTEQMQYNCHCMEGSIPFVGVSGYANAVQGHGVAPAFLIEYGLVVDGGVSGHRAVDAYANQFDAGGVPSAMKCILQQRRLGTLANPLYNYVCGDMAITCSGVFQSGTMMYINSVGTTGQAQVNSASSYGAGVFANGLIYVIGTAASCPAILRNVPGTRQRIWNSIITFEHYNDGITAIDGIAAGQTASAMDTEVKNCICAVQNTTYTFKLFNCNNNYQTDGTTVLSPRIQDGNMYIGFNSGFGEPTYCNFNNDTHAVTATTIPTNMHYADTSIVAYLVPSGGVAGVNLMEYDGLERLRGTQVVVGPGGGGVVVGGERNRVMRSRRRSA